MARVLVNSRGTKIGAYHFPDKKRPALCVEKGNTVVVYGYFKDDNTAMDFMHELAIAVGAEEVNNERR